jgi:hypothetical protein
MSWVFKHDCITPRGGGHFHWTKVSSDTYASVERSRRLPADVRRSHCGRTAPQANLPYLRESI